MTSYQPQQYPLTWLDVFTEQPLRGNGLAVVHDADSLDDSTMQLFARETQLSETTFIQSTQQQADYRNRIFAPPGEMRFAGHPSLGSAVAVAYRGGKQRATFTQETHAGCQGITVEFLQRQLAYASMQQENAVFGELVDPQPLLAAIGLGQVDCHPTLKPQMVSTGTPHLVFPLQSQAALERISVDVQQLVALLPPLVVLYLAAVGPGAPTVFARGFFADRGAVREDPATGSAAGPLGAYLSRYQQQRTLTVIQGVEMGRESKLYVDMAKEPVSVGGYVVIVSEGTVYL